MLRIRLTRVGKKNSPAYRVVIADKRRAVKRKFIEIVGHYNPTLNPKEIVINKERALFWMGNGAQPSDTVNNLMCDLGILDKKDKINKVYGKKLTKKAIKAGPKQEMDHGQNEPQKDENLEESKTVEEEVTSVDAASTEEATPEKEEETVESTEPTEKEKSQE